MNIRALVLIIIFIFINNSIHLYPVTVDRVLVREVQQLITKTFGKRYPLSCYEEITTLLLHLEQLLKRSLRVESSEFEKNSLLYVQCLLSEFVLFSFMVRDNLLKCEHALVYISFLIQHTHVFFERHAPKLLEGRNRPMELDYQPIDGTQSPSVSGNQNRSYHTTRFVVNGMVSAFAVGSIYVILKHYFLSSMAYEVQKFDRDINKILKVNDDAEVKMSKVVDDVLTCKTVSKSINRKLIDLELSLQNSIDRIESACDQLLKDYDEAIKCSHDSIKAVQGTLQEKVRKISEACSLITLQTAKAKERGCLLAILLGPYEPKSTFFSNLKSSIYNEDIRNFFGKR